MIGDFYKAVNLYSWAKKIYKKGAYVDVWMALWTQTSCEQEENVPFGHWCAYFPFPFTKANFDAPCFCILNIIGSEGDDVSDI